MPRTYARIDVKRGADTEWRSLSPEQQAVYDFLLTHPKLSTCGALDVKLLTWAKQANALTQDHLEGLLQSLVDRGFIAWDRDTDELVLRTFVRQDGVLQNKNLGKSMWSSWSCLESDALKSFLVDNLPEPAFDKRFDPPKSVLKNRRSSGDPDGGLNQPNDPLSEPPHPHPQPQLDPSSAASGTDWGEAENLDPRYRYTPRHLRSRETWSR